MSRKSYVERVMSFITNMQYHKDGGSEPQPGPGPEPSEWVVWDRTYKHRFDAKTLNYDENVSWMPESGGLLNLYHLDGSIIVSEDDFNNAVDNSNDAVIATMSQEMEGQVIKACVFIQDSDNLSGMPLYTTDPVIFSGMPTEFDTVCTNTYNSLQIGDLDAVAIPSSTFTGGHVDALNGLFYYNLVSEQNLTKEGVEYEYLLVHDLRAYEFWRELDKHLPNDKRILFAQGTPNYTNGYVFANQPERDGDYFWNIGVELVQPIEAGQTTIHMYPSPEDANFKLVFNDGETGSGMSNEIKNGYIELVGSQLFAYYNTLPSLGL